MSTTHADVLRGTWYRQKYYIEDGFIKPYGGNIEAYNPFDFYKEGNREWNNLHHAFARIDLENEQEIEGFCSKFGLLGLFNREISKVVSYRHGNDLYYAGVPRRSDELMPMDKLISKFHIDRERFSGPKETMDKDGYTLLQDNRITALDTWELVGDFKRECRRFKWIIDIQAAVADNDIFKIKELLKESDSPVYHDLAKETGKRVLLVANGVIMWHINQELENMVSPLLTFDDKSNRISKSVMWRCESLLTSLYTMLFLDITRGALTRRCKKADCGRFFEAANASVKYCDSSCQVADKTKRYRDKKKTASP